MSEAVGVLGTPEPAPAGVWDAALDHALSAVDDDGLELLVPDLWGEPDHSDSVADVDDPGGDHPPDDWDADGRHSGAHAPGTGDDTDDGDVGDWSGDADDDHWSPW